MPARRLDASLGLADGLPGALELGLGLGVGGAGLVLLREGAQKRSRAGQPRLDGGRGGARALDPVGDAVARRLGDEAAARELLALSAARGQGLLGLVAAL